MASLKNNFFIIIGVIVICILILLTGLLIGVFLGVNIVQKGSSPSPSAILPSSTPEYTITPSPTISFIEPIIGIWETAPKGNSVSIYKFYQNGTFEINDPNPASRTQEGVWENLGNNHYKIQITSGFGGMVIGSKEYIINEYDLLNLDGSFYATKFCQDPYAHVFYHYNQNGQIDGIGITK